MPRATKPISEVEKFLIRQKMRESGMSAKTLSTRLGASPRYVRNVLCGSGHSRKLVYRIAACLGFPQEPNFGYVSLPGLVPQESFPGCGVVIVPKEYAPLFGKMLLSAAKNEIPAGHELRLDFSGPAVIHVKKKLSKRKSK